MRSLLVAALVAGFGRVALASNTELPPCPDMDSRDPVEYVGCFNDGNPPALIMRSHQDQGNMTVEKCAAVCTGQFHHG
jgi:hypothetical protein